MRRSVSVLAVLAATALAGCAAAPAVYRSDAALTAGSSPGQYEVTFVIVKVLKSGLGPVVSPHLTLAEGKKGAVEIVDDRTRIVCTALVRKQDGEVVAQTTTEVEQGGKPVWSRSQVVGLTAAAAPDGPSPPKQ